MAPAGHVGRGRDAAPGPLAGCRAVITRERPGSLAELLAAEGAEIVHVPLIEVADPADGGVELAAALGDLGPGDWVMVTSPAGAERVVDHLGVALADGSISIACVGTATAAVVESAIGRAADLVPDRQTAAELATAFVDRHAGGAPRRVLVAQADRAGDDLATGLRDAGHRVGTIVAYRTLTRTPTPTEIDRLASADLLLLASGSAAQGWIDAVGGDAERLTPAGVVVIGPTTAAVARRIGLKISAIAADHSVQGLVQAAITVWQQMPRGDDVDGPVADSSAGTPDRRASPSGD